MVHLLVLGLLALLFGGSAGRVCLRRILLLHRFPGGRDRQPIVPTSFINGFGYLSAHDGSPLSLGVTGTQKSGCPTTPTERSAIRQITGKAAAG